MNPVTKLDKMVPRNLQRKQKGNFLLIAAFLFALYIAFQSKKKKTILFSIDYAILFSELENQSVRLLFEHVMD